MAGGRVHARLWGTSVDAVAAELAAGGSGAPVRGRAGDVHGRRLGVAGRRMIAVINRECPVGDSDDNSNILQFPMPVAPEAPAAAADGGGEGDGAASQAPIIGRRELRELVINVSRLLDAFDLYISQVRMLAAIAKDRPGVSAGDIESIIRNAEVDGKRLSEIRAAYQALSDTLDEPDAEPGKDA